MKSVWSCPKCGRSFTRRNQRHACGTGDRSEVLKNRRPTIVSLYEDLERFVTTLGPVEFVTRERYVLLRSKRIFADLTVMTDALRLVVHLPRRVRHELIIKAAEDRKRYSHVAKLYTRKDLATFKPFLREAYKFSLE